MRVLELFSGIGGMQFALIAAGIEVDTVAVEINPVANHVYKHNCPKSKLLQKNILSLNIEELNKFSPEILLMSPPCQPFTRVGLKKDLEDSRTDPLKHILSFLPAITSLNYVLVENVKGFECSEARNKLVRCLEELNFGLQEFLLSPSQIGVPNSRTRYYLLAKKQPLQFCFVKSEMTDKLPEEAAEILISLNKHFPKIHCVADVLEADSTSSSAIREYMLTENNLKRAWVMDIVTPDSTRTCCFTKAYGHYAEGTGSVYCPHNQEAVDAVFKSKSQDSVTQEELRCLNLRYFTPREVARLMSFPDKTFKFPKDVTRKQSYRLLGNSINVKVVALLINLLLCEPNI